MQCQSKDEFEHTLGRPNLLYRACNREIAMMPEFRLLICLICVSVRSGMFSTKEITVLSLALIWILSNHVPRTE